MRDRLSIDGRYLLKDLQEIEQRAAYIRQKLEDMDGKPIEVMLVVNVVKAREAIRAAYDLLDK